MAADELDFGPATLPDDDLDVQAGMSRLRLLRELEAIEEQGTPPNNLG